MESLVIGSFRFALDLAVKATFLFSLTGLLLLLLRRRSAASRHLLGTAGLAAALLFPLLGSVLPSLEVPLLPSPVAEGRPTPRVWPQDLARTAQPARASNGVVGLERSALPPDFDDARSPALAARPPTLRPERFGKPETKKRAPSLFVLPLTAMAAALGIWIAGAALLLARLAVGLARVRRCRQRATRILSPAWTVLARNLGESVGVRVDVPLFFAEQLPVAVTSGLRRPVLLVPQSAVHWDFGRRRVVLLHELAHIARRDWPALLLAEIVVVLYWFHPLVWVLSQRLRRDGERAADDRVLSSGTKPSVYAGHLLGIIRSLKPAPRRALPVMGMARPSHFEERLRAILDPQTRRRRPTTSHIRIAALGLVAAAGGAAMFQPWAPQCAGASIAADLSPVAASDAGSAIRETTRDCPAGIRAILPKQSARPGAKRSTLRAGDVNGGFVGGVEDGVTGGTPNLLPGGVENDVKDGIEPGVSGGVEGGVPSVEGGVPGVVKASHRRESDGRDAYRRARKQHEQGEYAEAARSFVDAYEAGYRRDVAAYNAACAYARSGNRDEAWEWLAKSSAEGFHASSHIEGDEDLASLRSDPRLSEFRANLKSSERESRLGSEEAAAAVERFERLAKESSENGEEWYAAGKKLLSVGRYELAERAFKLAARSKFRVGAALYNTACALSLEGDRAGALDFLQQSIEAGFDDPKLIRTDGDLDAIRSEPRYRQLVELAEALTLKPDADSFWKKAESLLDGSTARERGRWESAARRFQEFANQHPQLGRAWFNLGYASLAAGNAETALRAFERSLSLDYRRPTSTYNIACSYARLGRKDEAFAWLFQALDAGFEGEGTLRHDADLNSLHGDRRFREALKVAERAKSPRR